jgi:predicted DCC family thiol-disulfide oxidoreductase YuxK
MAVAEPPGLPPRLVLFDGVCAFCDRAVLWLIARDAHRRLHFAPLQGDAAAQLRRRHPQIPDDIDTLVYVESDAAGERVSLRSEAVFRVLAELSSPWRHLAWLRLLPRPLTDWAYRLFARHRYRLFGRRDACVVPDADERSRVIA